MMERTRIERVKRWLLETDASVAEIAELTGFSHPEYMSVVFRRANGVAPREWRVARQRSREPVQYGRVENRA
jgi:LacI family transcriptional regulator